MNSINPCTIYNKDMFDDEMVDHIDNCETCIDFYNGVEKDDN